MSLYCNAVLSFTGLAATTEVKGFSCVRRCDPNFSAADLSSRITYVACKNCIDILTVNTINPGLLKLKQGDTGTLNLTAKTADGGSDLLFAGAATVLGVEGDVQFADVESPVSATFAIISDDGTTPLLTVTP